MPCPFFDRQQCHSCSAMSQPYEQQVAAKDANLKALFAERMPLNWLEPVKSDELACRNKAKMVVLGAAHAPILGAESKLGGEAVSLINCPLYPQDMQELLAYLQDWIRTSGIPPYNKTKKKGELKFILLTRAQESGEFMLRLVLRSRDALPRVERNLERLLMAFPQVTVVSVNLQPVHMARLEGEEEIYLTERTHLTEVFNGVPLAVRPKSFFQTNPKVASQLYATAQRWVSECAPTRMWDLFCGVGGFALHCARDIAEVTGIEIEPEAIASAKHSAAQIGIDNLNFAALDSTQFSLSQDKVPELVLVNPPRRGLGQALVTQLTSLAPKWIVYSSCNPQTLRQDIDGFSDYQLVQMQWFDMFPHTEHVEAMVLLERREN
ncbi:23S rRNA (uracil(747)-C(5))-methyltransferase RlmC [Vibrio sp. SM6]|uniref:23S rRNA (uracil(747)-C(5))-methyltransferase RlmC n=1 Tax=Vibrio agarilyticus TaxID=2726741 RepID=A0A7X8YG01_9VIBR|nr:23S rRNA (uracil(747)-C(5))-methyltransferase RlmC [Vibrio agarilyticus]NLS12174.1 23S rRNA (uracil(747)-C(5))-methyltransferase RlmC [Vibrio agarilyticus]